MEGTAVASTARSLSAAEANAPRLGVSLIGRLSLRFQDRTVELRTRKAAAVLAVARRQRRIEGLRHHALRPNRPAGRTSNTIAMMTKITVFDASG